MLLGAASALAATLTGATYDDPNLSPATAEAGFRVHSDGTLDSDQAGAWTDQYAWLTGSGTNADYSVRFTKTPPGGVALAAGSSANATWLACSTTRTWYITNSVASSMKEYIGTLEIAETANLANVLATATITLQASLDL